MGSQRRHFPIVVAVFLLSSSCYSQKVHIIDPDLSETWKSARNVYDFDVKDIDGTYKCMEMYRGFWIIIVNIENNINVHPNKFQELISIHTDYHDRGFKVVAFPTNAFSSKYYKIQNELSSKILKRHNILFDVMETTIINGPMTHPLWKYLKYSLHIDKIDKEFTKIIVNTVGEPVYIIEGDASPEKLFELFDGLE